MSIADRLRAEEQLRMQSDVLDAVANAVVITDRLGTIQAVNPAFTTLTGYTAREVVGQNPRLLKGGREDEVFYRNLWQTISAGRIWHGVLTNRHKDGHLYAEEMTITPLRNTAGEIDRYVAIKQDVSERRRAEAAVLESKRFLQSTLDALSSHIAILDEHGTIIEVNAAWDRFGRANGLAGHQLGAGVNYLRLCEQATGPNAKEAAAVAAGLRDVTAGTVAEFRMEYPCHSPRQQRWFVLRATRFSGDGPVRVVVAHEDITPRKLAEEALVEETTRRRMLFENSPDGILLIDPQTTRFIEFNAAAHRQLGYSRTEFAQLGIADVEAVETRKETQARVAQVLSGRKAEFETLQRTKGGEIRNVQVSAQCFDILGQPVYHCLWRDITERKRLEARLLQTQKLETIGRLAGGVAHEFNSILTTIMGQSDLLLGQLPPGELPARGVLEIRQAAARAALLTQQLLAYGRKQILQPERLDLNALLASLDGMLRHLVGDRVELLLAPAAGLPAVKADAEQVAQVVMNMAANAAEAMPAGGRLTLETADVLLDQEHASRFADLKAGPYVMLAITDTGAGMSEDVKARIFEPFFSTKRTGSGTGLGLSSCYGIIRQSGGQIGVYSEPGQGTTFKIYLPPAGPEPADPCPPPAAPGLPGGTETIALVEADADLREMAAALLRRLGYTVQATATGREALPALHPAEATPIDLLIADAELEDLSGQELSDRLRLRHPHLRTLLTSAAEPAILQPGATAQGAAHLHKPYTPSALARRVREVLDGSAASPAPFAQGGPDSEEPIERNTP